MPVLPSFHTPGMVTPLCPVVPSLAISQLDPDNTIRDFLNANSNAPWDAPFMPTANWAPPLSQFRATEQGCVTSDSQPSSSAPPLASGVVPDSGDPGSLSGNNGFTKTVEDTDRPEVPVNEGIRDVSTWAVRNPGARVIQPHSSRQISEAQKASWAIARQQRAVKKAVLDNAVQEYLTQQTSKLEEIAFKHNVTVEYLKGLVGGQTYYHNPRKVQRHNALLHAKALEVNTDRPTGTKYSLKEIQRMVKEDERLQNLTQEELDHHITTLGEHRDTKTHGVRANNVAAARDVLATMDKIVKELTGLRNRTGIYATLLVTRGHINDSIQSTWTTTDNSAEFWEDVFGHQIVDIAHQYEQWACTQNQNLLERDSLGSLRKQITKAISSGLEKITNKKHIVMNYHNYDTAIVETYGVRLVGWPEDAKFANPSVIGTVAEARKIRDALRSGTCFWKKLSKSELDLFATELNARRAAGIPRRRKAPTDGNQNVRPWKMARSTHKRLLPKSAATIPTSDEEDSDEDA
ncbi:hypothetical protein EDD15DRAFT_2373791 [Pisolithus albus]|nr:hypothetical protein EDD15DRAFT_2373791 [Pisolithus albus]